MFPPYFKGWLGQEYRQKTIILDYRVVADGICVSGKDTQLQTQNIHNKIDKASQTQPISGFHEQSVSVGLIQTNLRCSKKSSSAEMVVKTMSFETEAQVYLRCILLGGNAGRSRKGYRRTRQSHKNTNSEYRLATGNPR